MLDLIQNQVGDHQLHESGPDLFCLAFLLKDLPETSLPKKAIIS